MDRRTRVRVVLSLLVVATMALPLQAQSFVEHIEPPVVERGKTTRVVVVGSDFGKAIGLWTTLPGGAMKVVQAGTATATRAEFDISVAADAPVGVCGMRLATIDGLGNAFLMLVDDLPVRPAPAESPAKVTLPASLWCPVVEARVHKFAIEVKGGQRVAFEAVGNRLGKDVDPLITIRDARGRVIAEHDNEGGLYFDCRFEQVFEEAGTYTVELRDARFHGVEHGYFVLRMGRFPAARVAVPMAVRGGKRNELTLAEGATVDIDAPNLPAAGLFSAVIRRPGDEGSAWLPLETTDIVTTVHRPPGSTFEEGTPTPVPAVLCGVLHKPGERQFFRLVLGKNQRIVVRGEAKAFNSPADLELAITDPKGKELRRVAENQQEEVVLDFNAGNGGVFGLRVGDVHRDGGTAFAYRLEVTTGQPRVSVIADVEGLTVPRGDYQTMPLAVTRTDYAGPIALSLVDAPAGVTLTPGEIGEGASTVVCKLAVSAEAALGLHTLQILARPTGKDELPATLVRTRPLIDKQIINVDLIPHALREDQRRLPPAFADRFALQVTPPAPFTMELPEALVTLGRYQHADFPIVTTRVAGFDGPITFAAKGGQIAVKDDIRSRVYAELPRATADQVKVQGSIHSRILTNLTKHRVDVTAVGIDKGRRVFLTRTFDIDIRAAFQVATEPAKLTLTPGSSAKFRLTADRLKGFDDDVTVQLSASAGLTLPDTVVIPRGQNGVDVELKVAADRPPGRQNVGFNATATVNGFEEENRGRPLEIEVPAPPKKK